MIEHELRWKVYKVITMKKMWRWYWIGWVLMSWNAFWLSFDLAQGRYVMLWLPAVAIIVGLYSQIRQYRTLKELNSAL